MRSALIAFLIMFATESWAGWRDMLPNFLKSAEEVFVQTCESQFKERLKAPTTYSRLEYTFRDRQATPVEAIYFDQEAHSEDMERFEKANKDIDNYAELLAGDKQSFKRKYGKHWESVMETKLLLLKMEIGFYERCAMKNKCPNRATAIIKYSAANSFGTPLANVYECSVNYREDLKSSVGSSVYIDGFQHLGWVVKSAKEGTKP